MTSFDAERQTIVYFLSCSIIHFAISSSDEYSSFTTSPPFLYASLTGLSAFSSLVAGHAAIGAVDEPFEPQWLRRER